MWDVRRSGGFREPVDAGFACSTAGTNGAASPGLITTITSDNAATSRDGHRLPASLTFQLSDFSELEIKLDPDQKALWCLMAPNGPPSFTPSMIRELNALHKSIHDFVDSCPGSAPINYYVMGSKIPSIYNMRGDLAFMIDAIRNKDREALRNYAFGCVEAVCNIWHGFNLPIISICLVEGDALGGGLEGVICFNLIVAERGSKMGMPEVLFGSFPGMGAYSFLSRRLNITAAEKMIRSGNIYKAEDLYEMGIVDILANPSEGRTVIQKYIHENTRRHRLNVAMLNAKRRAAPLELKELQDITDIWVETALDLEEADLRRMEILAKAQIKRLSKTN